MEGCQREQKNFLSKREQFALQIRKQNRYEIMQKSRNLQNYLKITQMNPKVTKDEQFVDHRFEDYTKKLNGSSFQLQNLNELVNAINCPDILNQHYGAIGISRIISVQCNPPIQAIIDSGAIPRLMQLARQEEYPQLQFEATWTLANMTLGTVTQTQQLINTGMIELLMKLIVSPMVEIAREAIWAIGNISNDCSQNRDILIRKGTILHIISCIRDMKNQQLREPLLWALSGLCRGSHQSNCCIVKDAVLILVQMVTKINFQHSDVFADCCWSISQNFQKIQNDYQKIINRQFISILVENLNSDNFSVQIYAIRLISHIVKINRYIKLVLENQNTMKNLYNMLNSPKRLIRVEVCWVLSNIASSDQNNINQIINNQKLVEKLLLMFANDGEDVKKQLCYLFANFTVEGELISTIRFYKNINIMKYYVSVFQSIDANLVLHSLQNMYQILQFGEKFKKNTKQNPFITDLTDLGAIRLLEELQMHKNEQIYNAVIKIISDFFEIDHQLSI